MNHMRKSARGFTLVELLIVIVVIAILAAITLVTYSGIQQKARDSQRMSDLNAIAKGLQMYAIDNDNYIETGSGCGSSGNGGGYFNANDSAYPRSIGDCLKPYTGGVELMDPSGKRSCSGLECRTYMKYTCILNGAAATYVYANLESKGHTSTDTDGTCKDTIDTSYGMNYFVRVN